MNHDIEAGHRVAVPVSTGFLHRPAGQLSGALPGRSRRTRGFSLVELLVVIAVVALLMVMIVMGVQAARDASRRLKCSSNLGQLGLAFHNYHEVHSQLPPVYVAIHNKVLPSFLGIGGATDDANIHTYGEYLLPFIDHNDIFSKIDFKQPYFAPVDLTPLGLPNYTADNQSAVAVSLPIFLCPAAPRSQNPHSFTWKGDLPIPITYRAGGNDYGPSNGIVRGALLSLAPQNGGSSGEGILSNNIPSAKLALVTDGLASTALMWEIAGRPDLWQRGKRIGNEKTAGGGWADVLNAEAWFGGTSHDGSTVGGPCAVNCSNRFGGGTYSFHPGGVHVLLCDGSVRFISENLSVETFVELVTYQGDTSSGKPD